MLNARLVDEAVNKSGGEKKRLQRMVLNGQIDQLTATLAAMRIDRIQNAAKLDQLNQPTVAEQVLNPQPQMSPKGGPQGGMVPQMPPQGMAATPQAQQMPQQAQMGAPQAPQMQQPQGMAMGGGLDSIDYVEGDYAAGGIVSFAAGDPVRMGITDDQLRNMSRAQLRAVASNGNIPPNIRSAAAARLQSITPAQGQQPTVGGLASTDLMRVPNVSGAMDRVGQAIMGTGDVDRNIEVSDTGIPEGQFRGVVTGQTPTEKLMGANQSLEQGMETFADGMVSRPDQGQRIDPNRFSTGTLTEAEARRIEGGEGGIFDALRRGANAMFGAADVANEVPIDRSGQKVDMGGKTLPNAFQDRGGFSLADLYNEYAPRVKRSVMGAENQMDMPDPEGMLVTGFSGQDSVDANAYQSGTGDTIRRGPVEEAQARAAREVDTTIDDGDLRSMPFRDFDDGDLRSMPERVAQTEEAAKTIAGDQKTTTGTTTTKGDTTAAAASENAGVQELENVGVKGDTLTTIGSLTDMFKNEEGPAAKRYREYLQNLPKQAGQRKSDALAMFALQTGIGMLAQPGGQTALQAAGKSANNAMKTYVEEMRDIRGLEEKALKGEVALEELQQKRADANLKIAADIYGRQLVADTSLAAARINAGKPTDATRGINRFVDAINEKVANGEMKPMSPAQIRLKAQNDYYGLLAEVQASKLAQSSVTDQATIINSIQTNARAEAEAQFEAFIGAQKDAYKLTSEQRQQKLNELYKDALTRQTEGPLGQLLKSYGGKGTTGNPLVDKYLQ